MSNKAYRIATDEEFEERNCYELYDLLVGPNGFECLLTEPEDRNWYRDGSDVINELNRLHEENRSLKDQLERVKDYLPNE